VDQHWRGHDATEVRRRTHRSLAFGCSGARKLASGGRARRGEGGELILTLTRARGLARWPGDGSATAAGMKLGGGGALA
jgi:hypothetical protein